MGCEGDILVGTDVEILDVFEGNILDVFVSLLANVVVTSDMTGVAIIVGRICIDFDSVLLVDKTANIIWSLQSISERCQWIFGMLRI